MYRLTGEQISIAVERIVRNLFNYCKAQNLRTLVLGVSGGLDSAVTLALAMRASVLAAEEGYKLRVIGVMMPCQSSSKALELGRMVIQKFGAQEWLVELDKFFQSSYKDVFFGLNEHLVELNQDNEIWIPGDLAFSKKVTQGNIKARLRMIVLYHIARWTQGIVLSTDNLSEYLMGFWTLHGDVGDIGPIQNIFKGLELCDIARHLGVPQKIIAAIPDDGLGVAEGGDEAQLGADYSNIDKIMITLLRSGIDEDGSFDQLENLPEVGGIDPAVTRIIAERYLSTAFKRGSILKEDSFSRGALGLPAIEEIKF